jgi:hypothetical protein
MYSLANKIYDYCEKNSNFFTYKEYDSIYNFTATYNFNIKWYNKNKSLDYINKIVLDKSFDKFIESDEELNTILNNYKRCLKIKKCTK